MDSPFDQWIALTDAYARRLSAAAQGDERAMAELRVLAGDVSQFPVEQVIASGHLPLPTPPQPNR